MTNAYDKFDHIKYVECECGLYSHTTRFIFDKECNEYWIEGKFDRFPNDMNPKYMLDSTIKDKIHRRWVNIKNYFRNIFYAIKGLPPSYDTIALWGPGEAYQIKEFIEETLPKEGK